MLASHLIALLIAAQPATPQDRFLQAVSAGDVPAVQLLLKQDPSLISTPSKTGATPVQRAVYYKQPRVLAILLAARPTLDMGSACTIGDLVAVKALEKSDPDSIGTLSADGLTPLCLAAAFDHPKVVLELLGHGADINAHSRSIEHVAPLNSAVFGKNASMVELLLKHGADPNIMEDGRWTSLDEASTNGDLRVVRLLLAHGADRALKDAKGKTARDYALETKHPAVAELLKP